MSRLPIRLRLTFAFALAMAVVLAATGMFLYFRLGSTLLESIDEHLETRAAELVPVVAAGRTDFRPEGEADERYVQILDARGEVLAGPRPVGGETTIPRLDLLELARQRRARRFDVGDAPGEVDKARVFATWVEAPAGGRVLLVGAALEDRDDALGGFLTELLVVGPAALLLVSLLGYGLATAALRPVDVMRGEAAKISASEPGRRLPLPRSEDEIARLGETLNAMLERLETAFEHERQFVADASHELRTPLALLQGELELALRRPRTAEELAEAIRSASAEAERLAQLAEELLVLARSDQGRLELRLHPLEGRELLTRVARRFAPAAEAAGRSVEAEPAVDFTFAGDPARLEQALGNLVENALNHGSGTVRLSARQRDGAVELHVVDEGEGFEPDFLPRAFERFSRADDARSGNGTGLGLTIAAAIAAAHGGTAHAANREDSRGADVWLTIPRAQDRPAVD